MYVELNDVAGSYEIDVEQFQEYVRCWYRPNDLVALSRKSEDGREGLSTTTLKASDLMKFDQASLETFIFDSKTGVTYDLYVNVCPVKRVISGNGVRANENDAQRMPGLWMDLDVKDGSFDSKEDILEFIERLPLKPSIIVDSGNGIHIYVKVKYPGDLLDRELSDSWQDLVKNIAGELHQDSTSDLARLLRVPGSAHTGKGTGVYASVRLLKGSVRAYPVEVVRQVVKDATSRLRARKAVARQYENELSVKTMNLATTGPFAELFLKANYEDYVNENIDWSEILEPKGWVLNRTMGDGSREWQRPGWTPGANKRSAVTDHPEKGIVSNVMSLRSEAPDTNLIDLREIRVPLSKARVMQRIWFNDDVDAFMNYLYNRFSN